MQKFFNKYNNNYINDFDHFIKIRKIRFKIK